MVSSEITDKSDMAWWRDARFGMFIHWGLYAVPAGSWKGTEQKGIGEWIQGHFKIPFSEYSALTDTFNPVDFDADAIVQLAKAAGMKYLVFTAKHHDGFAMYDSAVSEYTITKSTPFGRDPVRELSEACARHGVVFCLYYSQDLDWEHPDGGGNTWDYPEEEKCFARYLDEKCKPQLRELLTNYGPIGLVWFDMAHTISDTQALEIRDLVKSIQPKCLVSGRVGGGHGDYGNLGDNQIPIGRMTGDWECPATLNNTWGFKAQDHNWKSIDTLLYLLVDLAAKGVNYLLNIGPDALGKVPDESYKLLREIGEWMDVNSEAIYGTDASPYPYESDWGRVTVKNNNMYLFFYDYQAGNFSLHGVKNTVKHAELLSDSTAVIPTQQTRDDRHDLHQLDLTLPELSGNPKIPVIKLHLDGPAEIDDRLIQSSKGDVKLPAIMCELHVGSAEEKRNVQQDDGNAIAAVRAEQANEIENQSKLSVGRAGMIQNWVSTEDWLTWEFIVTEGGRFDLALHTVAPKYTPWQGGHRVTAEVADDSLSGEIEADEVVENPRSYHFEERISHLGTVTLSPGTQRLVLKADSINQDVRNGLCVSELELLRCE